MVNTIAEMGRTIKACGAPAVIGRVMGVRELRELDAAIRIPSAYYAREAAENWVEWAEKYPSENALLIWAMRLANVHD